MPKHAKIVPISAGRPTSQEPHKEMMVPSETEAAYNSRFRSCSLVTYGNSKHRKRRKPKRPDQHGEKLIYLPTPRSDDSCKT